VTCVALKTASFVRARPDELDDVAREIPLDPHFLDFSALCRMNAIPLTVVSDGFGEVIAAMLAGASADVPVLANRLAWLGEDRWRLDFPHANDLCRSAAGHCKCRALDREPGTLRILVGDGRSDFCAAEIADLVFAKGALSIASQRPRLPGVRHFAGATALLTEWTTRSPMRRR
jgi:2,3-diketo-5-methylthio-1-phosphopentane phosphatase